MNILAFDTGGEVLSLALISDDRSRTISMDGPMRHVQSLLPEIDGLSRAMGVPPDAMDLIVTARGPGSFTGLRIGISTAKGLSEGLGIPFVTVPSLDVIAYERLAVASVPVLPLIDARKGCFYGALYSPGINADGGEKCSNCSLNRQSDYFDLDHEELIRYLEQMLPPQSSLIVTGPGASLFFDRAQQQVPSSWYLDPFHRKASPLALAFLGRNTYTERGGDVPEMGPLYLRKSEAELLRKS